MILDLFIPIQYISHYSKCNVEELKAHGIKVFILDVDNTLISHFVNELDKSSIEFIKVIRDAGIIPVILSNNVKKRVEPLARQAGVDYFSFSCKPLSYNYHKVLRKYSCKSNEVAVLGDQLITDICGGNRMKFVTILQMPLTTSTNTSGKVTKIIDKYLYKVLKRKNILIKGEPYDHM